MRRKKISSHRYRTRVTLKRSIHSSDSPERVKRRLFKYLSVCGSFFTFHKTNSATVETSYPFIYESRENADKRKWYSTTFDLYFSCNNQWAIIYQEHSTEIRSKFSVCALGLGYRFAFTLTIIYLYFTSVLKRIKRIQRFFRLSENVSVSVGLLFSLLSSGKLRVSFSRKCQFFAKKAKTLWRLFNIEPDSIARSIHCSQIQMEI